MADSYDEEVADVHEHEVQIKAKDETEKIALGLVVQMTKK